MFIHYFSIIKYNYTLVFGNKHSFDHQIRNTRYNLNQIVGRIRSGDIIIVHDLWDNLEFIEKLIVFLTLGTLSYNIFFFAKKCF